jgi:hypothetical protein
MSTREKYFQSKVAKLLAGATCGPDLVKGGIRHTFIAPPKVEKDIQQVANPTTGVISAVI